MSRPVRESNVVLIQGPARLWDTSDFFGNLPASEAMKPGHKVELFDDGGVLSWRLQTTLTLPHQMAFVGWQSVSNEPITTAFAAGDHVPIWWVGPGAVINGILTAGETVVAGTSFLNSTGGVGTMAVQATPTADANNAHFLALDNKTTVPADTRCRFVRI